MLSYYEAFSIINKYFKGIKLRTEKVNLLDSLNRVLSEDIYSDIDMPPFNNSAMDGYAIRFNPEINSWSVIGEISAGNFNDSLIIDENSAVSIMTGGKIPDQADTVIPIEDVQIEGNIVRIIPESRYLMGMNIRTQGKDLGKDELAIAKNTLIRPNILTLAAACGKNSLSVYAGLNIGILITGDELVDFYQKPENDKIRATNDITLSAIIKETNMIPLNFGIVKDDKNQVKIKLLEALDSDIDLLITSGGVSVGKYDFLQEILIELGAKVIFWKVNIKPGKPLLFCEYVKENKRILIFGMPGNPVSIFAGFNIFVKPNVFELYGIKPEPVFKCILAEDIYKDDNKRHFINGNYYLNQDNVIYVSKTVGQNSGNIPNLGKSNCLIIFKEEYQCLNRGEVVECIKI